MSFAETIKNAIALVDEWRAGKRKTTSRSMDLALVIYAWLNTDEGSSVRQFPTNPDAPPRGRCS